MAETLKEHDAFGGVRGRHRSPFTVGLLSGCAAGITVQSCLFPLNTIKTRLQSRAIGSPWRQTLNSINPIPEP